MLEKGQSRVPFYEDVGAFYSSEVLSPFLVEQASSLQSKSLILVEQVSHPCRANFLKRGGQVWAFVPSGAHAKNGLYLLWACGHGPIGLTKPSFTFYPLQLPPSPLLVRRCYANGQLGGRLKQTVMMARTHGGDGWRR